MNFLTRKTNWFNAEFIIFKLSIAAVYVMLGAYFHTFFSHYYIPLFILFLITLTWTMYLWLKKMNLTKSKE